MKSIMPRRLHFVACVIFLTAWLYPCAVFAETCPHYLLLDDSVYNQDFSEASKFVLSPPIRKKEDIAKVVEHLGEPGASSRVAEMALEMIAPPT